VEKLVFAVADKNYFCQDGFFHGKSQFFPPSGKNMPTLPSTQFLGPARSHTANDILIGSTIQALLVVVIT